MEQQVNTIMLTMDALMDTRVGTCYRLDYALGRAMLTSPMYSGRKQDYFAKDPKYQKLWQKRDTLTLVNSTGTSVLQLVEELLKDSVTDPKAGPADFELRIYLNTAPYVLSADEIKMFENVIYTFFPQTSMLKVVHVKMEDLTPAWLTTNTVDAVVMYEWQDWLEHHEAALLDSPQPLLHLIGPKLRKYDVDFIAGEDTSAAQKILDDGAEFEMAEFGVQAFIALRTMPVHFFNSLFCKAA